jgi:hypothetical protein
VTELVTVKVDELPCGGDEGSSDGTIVLYHGTLLYLMQEILERGVRPAAHLNSRRAEVSRGRNIARDPAYVTPFPRHAIRYAAMRAAEHHHGLRTIAWDGGGEGRRARDASYGLLVQAEVPLTRYDSELEEVEGGVRPNEIVAFFRIDFPAITVPAGAQLGLRSFFRLAISAPLVDISAAGGSGWGSLLEP